MRKRYDRAAKSSAPPEPSLREILAQAGILTESDKQRIRLAARREAQPKEAGSPKALSVRM